MTLVVGTNTYISLADANSYFAARLQSDAWEAASTHDREVALQQATRGIERLEPAGWFGVPVNTPGTAAQPLQWPRYNVPNRRAGGSEIREDYLPIDAGTVYDSATIPTPLEEATCEEALELLKRAQDPGDLPAQRDNRKGIKSISIGGGSVSYTPQPVFGGCLASPEAWDLVRELRRTAPRRIGGIW